MDNEAMIMGDLVLLDSEVPKAINKLMEEHLEITAIHNHLINETPAKRDYLLPVRRYSEHDRK
jgi:hypothetical protein